MTLPMAPVKCPGCARALEQLAEECPHCRFSLHRMNVKYGAIPLHTRYLTDRAACLTLTEIKKLRERLDRFTKKFPQILFSIFISPLPRGGKVNEFVFWLANRARFSSTEARGPENFELLLVLDPEARTAALTMGYGLEHALREEDLQSALADAASAWEEGHIANGLFACIDAMTQKLQELSLRDAE